ncbi:acyltransferase family protein [Chryseobacterium sp. T1]
MQPQLSKLFFPALTGYRALAAWMIFIYHFFPFSNPKYPLFIKDIISGFHIGVDLFFVLSGFLITYRYYNDYPIHFRNYIVNRFSRIYPMYFIITLCVFLVGYITTDIWDQQKSIEALVSFTMTKALFSKFFLGGIPQGWTLTLEEMFYFTAPLYFIFIRKNKNALWLLPLLIFGIFALIKNLLAVPGNHFGFFQTNIHAYIIEFFAGIILGYIVLKKKISVKRNWVTYFGILIILLYLVTRPTLAFYVDLKSDMGRFGEMAFLSIVGIAPLLWGLIFEKTFIQNILSSKTLVLLGKSSFVFYLIHKGFIPIFINDYISDNKLVIFIILNIISVGLFTYVEEPLNLYFRKKFGKAKTAKSIS